MKDIGQSFRQKGLFGIMAGALGSVALTACNPGVAEQQHPNILMIAIDDLNDWIGVMNVHPNALTPNIDKLAERGTLFTNAHISAPLCGPSRASLLSGLRPSTTGIYGQVHYPLLIQNPVLENITFLPKYMADHGYATFSTGKIFHEGSPKEVFDFVGVERTNFGPKPAERVAYTPPPGHSTSTDWGAFPDKDEDMPDWQSAEWAIQQINNEHDKPFFLSVGFVRPHVPLFVPQKWFDMHPLEGVMLPLNMEGQLERLSETSRRFADLPQMPKMEWMKHEMRWEKSVQAYLASCTFVDHCVGRVLDALANSPHADNTIIILFSDHGYHLGTKGIWAKHTLWEESTRIPLIIATPEGIRDQRSHRPVGLINLYPTITELAGIPANTSNEGKSLVPLLNNTDAPGYEYALTTHGYENHAIRDERWRYIRYEDGTEELYDHFTDPREWKNLAGMSQFKFILTQMRGRLPESNAVTDPNAKPGMDYNNYLLELYERTRADKQ